METVIETGNQWVSVAPSDIDRQGVFAKSEIPKGTIIFPYCGEKISKAESTRRLEAGNAYLFILNDEFDLDGSGPENTARYANHSCRPNCESQQDGEDIWIQSLRDIQQGEEITINYGYGLEDHTENPCRCGEPDCVGYVVAEEHFETIRLLNLAPDETNQVD